MNVKEIYSNYDAQVIDYMLNLVTKLEAQYGKINEEWRVSLDLIAFNYDLIRQCQLDIAENGLTKEDSRGRMSKNPALMIVNQAEANLFKLLNSFGLNLMSKSKLKDVEKDDDGLDDLIQ